MYLDHAALMGEIGWENGFFSMHHPKNLATPWSRYFVNELEFGHDYSLGQKTLMATKVVYSFEAQRKLRTLLIDFHPDIAHLHCIYHHLSPSILPVLSEEGIPAVMTAHDLKVACPAYKMLNRTGVCERCKVGSVLNAVRYRCVRDSLAASVIVAVESALQRAMRIYQRHLARVVAPSRFYLEKFVEWGWRREKITYIPNYVDAARFEPHFDPGDYFLYFGRLAPEKGIATLLRAASEAGVPLKLVGDGPEATSLSTLNSRLGGMAEFLGYRSGAELHNLIRAARAIVLPSEWYENAPMSVLEGFAFGKPVIGAEIGGIPEMVEEDSGWTFTAGKTDELADLLRRVLAMPASQIRAVGRAARNKVQTRFNREGYVKAILKLYAELRAAGCTSEA